MKKYCLGGSIAVGKTSILNKIKNSIEIEEFYKKVLVTNEFDLDNSLIKELMGSTYGKKILPDELMQLYTQFDRWTNYIKGIIKASENNYSVVLYDRGPLDPLVFAMISIKDKNQLKLLKEYSVNLLRKIFRQYGKPDLYFILKVSDMNIIKERLNIRGREEEVKGKVSFIEDLNSKFHTYLLELCKELGIRYKVINASKKFNDVYSDVIKEIKENEKN